MCWTDNTIDKPPALHTADRIPSQHTMWFPEPHMRSEEPGVSSEYSCVSPKTQNET